MKTRIIALVGAALMCLAANADWRPLVEQGKTWKYYASVSSWDMSGVDKIYDFKLEGTTQIDGMDYAICNVYEAGTDIRLFGTPIGYLGETADHEVYLVTNPDFAKAAWANNDKVWRSLHTSALSEVKGDKRMLYSRTNPEKNLCLYGEYKADQLNAVSYASPSGAVLSGHGVNNSWFVEGIGYIEP